MVQGALRGHDQVGAGEAGVEVEVVEEHVEAGEQPGAEGCEARAQTAGRSGAEAVVQVGAHGPQVAGEDVRPVLQAGRQMLDLRGRRPLLRAEDAGHAALAAQHVVRVAGDQQLDVPQARVQAGRVDPGQPRQLTATAREFEAIGVQQSGAEGLERAGAPSDVPESPQPTRMRRTPVSSAARTSSPTP